MQALILAGGEGSRLRPLTATVPKPVIPLVDRPFISYMLDWLRDHAITEVIMSCGFLAAGVQNVLGDGTRYGLQIKYLEEPRPLGTGGAVKFAEQLLDERFFVLNGDVLTDIDLTAQLRQHEQTGAQGTLALIGVDDPSAYGLVRLTSNNAITEFVEKPSPDQIDTNLINAGAYILERSTLSLMATGTPISIEREVFPRLVNNGLYGFPTQGYWLDIGTPKRYLEATVDILEGNVRTAIQARLGYNYIAVGEGTVVGGRVVPPALIEANCTLAPGSRIGGRSVLGNNVTVGPDTVVESSVIFDSCHIGEGCVLHNCILAGGVTVGSNTHIKEQAVIGECVTIGANNILAAGIRVSPGVTISDGAIKF